MPSSEVWSTGTRLSVADWPLKTPVVASGTDVGARGVRSRSFGCLLKPWSPENRAAAACPERRTGPSARCDGPRGGSARGEEVALEHLGAEVEVKTSRILRHGRRAVEGRLIGIDQPDRMSR